MIGAYAPIVEKKPICPNKYWPFVIWLGTSVGQNKTGRQFST